MPATSSHVLPFQLRGITAQPLYSFFQELELAAPITRVMWALRQSRASGWPPGLLFSGLLGNRIQPEAVGNLRAGI